MNTIRWAVGAACLSLLVACGGGGGGKPNPPPQSEIPAALPVAYAVALSYGEDYLDIVDPGNANVLRSIRVSGRGSWRVTFSQSQSSDGRTQIYQHESVLYHIDVDGKLQAVDLARGGSTASRQVSSIDDACRILWHIDSDLTGKDSWLTIATAGTDGVCNTGDDTPVLVHSGMSASTDPAVVPFNLDGLITPGRDAAGRLHSLITLEPSVGRFVHWRLDSSGAHHSVETNNVSIPSVYTRWLGQVPGHHDRGIVQVGDTLHMLSWTSTSATLTPGLASGVSPGAIVATDGSRLYVVRTQPSLAILAFDGSSTALPTPLDPGKGDVTGLMASIDTVWVVQRNLSLPRTVSTLTSFSKTTGVAREVDHYEVPPGMLPFLGLELVGVKGNRLAYTKPVDDQDYDTSLYVIDHADATPRLLAERGSGVGVQAERTIVVGQLSNVTHLLWCDKGTVLSPVDCTALRFKSYNMATGAVAALGQGVTDPDASAVLDSAYLADIYAQHALITTQHADGATTTLWQFKPDVAGSLKFVIERGSSSSGSNPSGSSSSP